MTAPADEIVSLLRSAGAYLEGHFRLTSGLHSPAYFQCALLLQHPADAEKLGRLLAERLRALAPRAIRVVASPALGGLIIGHETARALGARFIFAERDASGGMAFRRGFSIAEGETAVVVEDVITTGGSTAEVVRALRSAGAAVAAAGSIVDRGGGRAEVGAPRVALATLDAPAYPPERCPLCAEGIPAAKPGSRPA